MKVIIAPDSFKESLTAMEVAKSIQTGFRKIIPNADYILCPMADGGEGTVQSLIDATDGEWINKKVQGPLGNEVEAFFGILGDQKTAVIEMASASGIHLVPKHLKDPKITTTYGTGELIKAALDLDVKKFIIGIGGSATNDGGAGMIQALGGRLLDKSGDELERGGKALKDLDSIDLSSLDSRLENVTISVACDVNNPLTGKYGASVIYGPQKGASEADINLLDDALSHYANVIYSQFGKKVDQIPGAGAAGGLGAAFLAFLPARLEQGGKIVTDVTGLESYIQHADLVITGEGGINHQTIHGKTPVYVASVAKKYDVPVIAICGSVADGYESVFDAGIDAVFSTLSQVVTFEELAETAKSDIEKTSENIARLMQFKL